MGEFKDLTGKRFGKLIVIKQQGHIHGGVAWLCKCDCGNDYVTSSGELLSKHCKSCGCYRTEILNKSRYKHGLNNTKIYKVWQSIKYRCKTNQSKIRKSYKDKGITVCKEWINSPENFYKWAIENGYKDGLTIDRIDVNGNYEPTNCRWVNMKTQANNKNNNHLITYKNETHTLAEWCDITGLNYTCILSRLKRGWTVEKTLTTPKLK